MMIIYGVFAETSVTKLFVGGMTVGIMTAISYVIVIGLVARYRKDIIPATPIGLDQIHGPAALKAVVPIVLLILLIFGGLFSGLFTATEAGAVGAAGSIVLAAFAGRLSWDVIRSSVLDTLGTCASLFIVGIAAVMFTKFLGLSGVAGIISGAALGPGLDYLTLMLIIVVIYLVLGMFMEPFGAMLVTLPVLLPILHAQNLDLVWFGVFVVKMLEIGMITPPLGMNVFVIRNVAAEYATLPEIFRGVALFLAADMIVVLLIVLFPSIVMFLPNLLQ
jgi:tripartite ATP-independent transporter DctM subunit